MKLGSEIDIESIEMSLELGGWCHGGLSMHSTQHAHMREQAVPSPMLEILHHISLLFGRQSRIGANED